jgi:hypothetical protein
MTRTEMVLKTFVYLPFNHKTMLLVWKNVIELTAMYESDYKLYYKAHTWGFHSPETWYCLVNQTLTFQGNTVFSSSRVQTFKTLQPLEVRTLSCLKTSGFNYPVLWHHIPEKWNSQLHHCEHLKTHNAYMSSSNSLNIWCWYYVTIQHFNHFPSVPVNGQTFKV